MFPIMLVEHLWGGIFCTNWLALSAKREEAHYSTTMRLGSYASNIQGRRPLHFAWFYPILSWPINHDWLNLSSFNKKRKICHKTPILVSGPFVALGETVHFPPWERFFDFSFPSYGRFLKKKPSKLRHILKFVSWYRYFSTFICPSLFLWKDTVTFKL